MKRSAAWWARLTTAERRQLTSLGRRATEHSYDGAGYARCTACSRQISTWGLCPRCRMVKDTLIAKADKEA